jgi:anti-sigma B factor antagonist
MAASCPPLERRLPAGAGTVTLMKQQVATPPLAVDVTADADGATVRVVGEIDLDTVDELATVAPAAVDPLRPGVLVLDFAEVQFCDSAGIKALVQLRQHCDDLGWRLTMVGLQPPVRRVLVDYTGMGEYLNIQK